MSMQSVVAVIQETDTALHPCCCTPVFEVPTSASAVLVPTCATPGLVLTFALAVFVPLATCAVFQSHSCPAVLWPRWSPPLPIWEWTWSNKMLQLDQAKHVATAQISQCASLWLCPCMLHSCPAVLRPRWCPPLPKWEWALSNKMLQLDHAKHVATAQISQCASLWLRPMYSELA